MEQLFLNALEGDLRQSNGYGKYMQKMGWKIVQIPNTKYQAFVKKIMLKNFCKIQRIPANISWDNIDQLIKQEKIFLCKLEPGLGTFGISSAAQHGFKNDNNPYLGSRTMYVDLLPSETEILLSFGQETKYKINHVKKTNPKININDFDKFYEIFSKTLKLKKIWYPPKGLFENMVDSMETNCFCIDIEGTSGCFVAINNNVATYLYSGTVEAGKNSNYPYLMVWEAMKEAKRRKCTVWDFEGIYDPRWPNPKWKSFSFFKQRFHGIEVEFPGSYTKISWRNLV